jgi:anaerobic selenocysteine-containing dehydrogenase
MSQVEVRTICMRDCPDACSILATVEDGRVIRQRGDPDHGVTRGFLCARGNAYLKRQYDPARLRSPLRRTAHGWERLSWEDALDLVAEKLVRCRDAWGPRSILAVHYSGMRGWVAKVLTRLFWAHVGGVTMSRGGLSIETLGAAQAADFGADDTHAPQDLAHSRAFVLWGKNVAVTHLHWAAFITEARKRGAPVHVIDPVCTATAKQADRFYQIRPGTDGLLALGVARRLLERQALDTAFISAHTAGFEAYRRLVLTRSLADIAQATDLSMAQIDEIADCYVATKPVATLIGLGPSYWPRGGASVRLIDALAALSGNIGIPGGGVGTSFFARPPFDWSILDAAPTSAGRHVRLPYLGDDLFAASEPPLKLGWIAGANPAATVPNTTRVKEGLGALEYLVVVDQFLTATAELAHLVLPCTTYLETEDLVTTFGHTWLGLAQAAVPPEGEARSDATILQGLAVRLGFGPVLAGTPEVWMRRLLGPLAAHGVTLETLRQGPQPNPLTPTVPFADHRFRTPSGRFEFLDEFAPPAPLSGGLHLVATKTLRMVNSQILPEDLPAEPTVAMHPETVALLGVTGGQRVRVVSSAGAVEARLAADAAVRRDVVLFNPALWQGDLSGVNQLREARVTDLGESAALHATTVTVLPA